MDKEKKAKPTQRRWHTMTEMRQMPDAELQELVKSFGWSDEVIGKKDRADMMVKIMNEQFHLRNQGYEFEKGGRQ